MKLLAIRALNLQNHRAFNEVIAPTAKVIMLAGGNGAGKSALIDGIRLCLTGELPRELRFKNELPSLITQGQTDGWVGVEVLTEDGKAEYRTSLRNGGGGATTKFGHSAIALHPQTFMLLQPNERRKALFEMAGISLKVSDIVAVLIQDGHAEARVKRLNAALQGGFDLGARTAKEYASEARGAWGAVTGETWGSQKGEVWRAPQPTVEIPSSQYAKELDKARNDLLPLQSRVDVLEADERQWKATEGLADSSNLPELRSTVHTLQQRVTELEREGRDLAKAAAAHGGWTAPCPACGVLLECSKGAGDLHEYQAPKVAPPLAKAEGERTDRLLAKAKADLSTAEKKLGAAEQAKRMRDTLPQRPTQGEMEQAATALAQAQHTFRLAQEGFKKAQDDEQTAANAGLRTVDAKRRHDDVVGFTALSEAIAALPGKFLAEALASINLRMGAMTGVLGAPVQIGEDMDLRYGTIPYGLASESERWRCELAMGMAIAKDHLGLVLMDRFDCIEPKDRGPLLQWMGSQEGVQIVLGATLKQAPTLPEGFHVRWLGK